MKLRNSWKWLVALGAVFVPASVLAVTVPNSFTAGEAIVAADMNDNFAELEAAVSALETDKADAPTSGAFPTTATGALSYAYVSCGASSCSVGASYAFNSAGDLPTASRTSAGNYSVSFPGAPLTGGGHVQVTSYSGSNANYCKVGSWGAGSVSVDCYDPSGTAADTSFTILVMN